MPILLDKLEWPIGEAVSLVRDEGDDFHIFKPPEDWPGGDNVVMFIAKDKKGYDKLAAKLQSIVIQIKHHNDKCDCP